MSTAVDLLVLVLFVGVALVAIPFVVYVTMKVGTYGYLKGRSQFYRDHPKERRRGEVEEGS